MADYVAATAENIAAKAKASTRVAVNQPIVTALFSAVTSYRALAYGS